MVQGERSIHSKPYPGLRQRLGASALVLVSQLLFAGAARVAWGELWGGLSAELWITLLLPSVCVVLVFPRLACALVTAICAIAAYGILAGDTFDWSPDAPYDLAGAHRRTFIWDIVARPAAPGLLLAVGTWWLVRRSDTGRPYWLSPAGQVIFTLAYSAAASFILLRFG